MGCISGPADCRLKRKDGGERTTRLEPALGNLLDVLVGGVDDLSQVASIDLLLKDPHLDLIVVLTEQLDVASNDLGNSGTPRKIPNSVSMRMSSWLES